VASLRLIRRRQIERQAEGYLELEMPQQALQALDRLGGDDEFGPRGFFLCGEALKMLGRYPEAIAPLEKAADAAPGAIEVWLSLGWCYKRVGRADLAAEAIEQALESEPDEALLHYKLACYLSLAGQKSPALVHLSRALELDSDYRALIDKESDFDSIRSDPEFQALLGLGV